MVLPNRRRIAASGGLFAVVFLLSSVPGASAFRLLHVADFGDQPRVVRVGDLNGDAHDDLIVASDCEVHVLLGHGDATFGSPTSNPVTGRSCGISRPSLAQGDLNDDGHRDLLFTRFDDPNVWVMTGNGDGTFAAPVAQPTATGDPAVSVTAIDLNNDGRDDVVALEHTQALSFPDDVMVRLANASGGFDPAVRYQVDLHEAYSIVAGRFDSDANADVAIGVQHCDPAANCHNAIIELAGHGDGTIGTPAVINGIPQTVGQLVLLRSGQVPTAMLAAPLRGLTRDDVLITANFVQSLLPDASGALTGSPTHDTISGGFGDIGDLDRDGVLDLAVAAQGPSAQVSVLLGDGAGDFDVEASLALRGLSALSDDQVTDVDEDGWPDLAMVALTQGHELDLVLSTPTGGLDPSGVDFGTVQVGSRSAQQRITVFNAGVRPLAITDATLSGPFAISLNSCDGATLDLFEACHIDVVFTPSSSETGTGRLVVNTTDPDGPLTATLRGVGTGLAGSSAPAAHAAPPAVAPLSSTAVVRPLSARALLRALRIPSGLQASASGFVSVGSATNPPVRSVTVRLDAAGGDARALAAARRSLLGKTKVTVPAGARRAIKVRLTRSARAALRRRGRMRLQIRLSAVDRTGRTVNANTTRTLTARRRAR